MADDLDGYLRRLPFRTRRELVKEIRRQAERVRGAMEDAAPEGPTGNLKRSPRVRRGRNSLELIVTVGGELTTKEIRDGSGEPYDYALAVEFGNEHAPANPFVFRTWEGMKDDVNDEIHAAVQFAIEDSE